MSPRPRFIPFIRQIVDLRRETEYDATIEQIREDAALRTGSRWALAFAIVIASVGLNVNSTAVIIGAMLISPLMGPIVGAGAALGTSDIPLLRKSLTNLLIATLIALVASTVYFAITPLAEAQSELLARTRPTLYDVVIALFGGSAGIVAASRKTNKGQVAPGVAIATALMPPLCTAGFGLAHLDPWIFLGAMNLFFINALFICLATLGFIRLMAFERVSEPEPDARRRMRLIISILTVAIVIPSMYTGFYVVQETRFNSAARRFINEQLTFANRSQLNVELSYGRDISMIDLTLIGEPLPPAAVDSIRAKLPRYGLAKARLIVRQPLGAQPSIQQISDLVRQGVFRDLDARAQTSASAPDPRVAVLEAELVRSRGAVLPIAPLATELGALFPTFRSLSVAPIVSAKSSTATTNDSTAVLSALVGWSRLPSKADQQKVRDFIAVRLQRDSIRLTSTLER
ncbi:MAG: DUF389 domain-containing protein [Gemmatimonadaceae bacterium]|nr:DUF389 domain-containing protein [Gemmatimonadaceae bacterium]